MLKKKAQFYILMAAVITVVLTGLIAIVNYAIVKPEPVQFYDLSKQLENEANRVIDYGTYSGKDVASYVENFVQNFLEYAQEKDPKLGLIYIYGNSSYLTVVNHGKDDAGINTTTNKTLLYGSNAEAVSQIRVDIGGQQIGKKVIEEKGIFGNIRQTFGPSKTVSVTIGNKVYSFDLRGEQYFFAIVKSERENETYYGLIGPQGTPQEACEQAGGTCKVSACSNYQFCSSLQETCATGYCCSGTCIALPSCTDGIQNQGETGVDCGGPCAVACIACGGKEYGTDCEGVCTICDGVSTCINTPKGQDYQNECSGLNCAANGYYYGWLGRSCLYSADASAQQHTCNGYGNCDSCLSQGPGALASNCGSQGCVNPLTCRSTTPGACFTSGQHGCPTDYECDFSGTCRKIYYETRYYRFATATVNGRTERTLITENLPGDGEMHGQYAYHEGCGDGLNYVDRSHVFILHSDGTATNIGAFVAPVYRYDWGEGYQSATWNCPQVYLAADDAVLINEGTDLTAGCSDCWSWVPYITERLNADRLKASTWTFVRYTGCGCVTEEAYWGLVEKDYTLCATRINEPSYATRIEGFSYRTRG